MTENVTRLPRPPESYNLPVWSGSFVSDLMEIAAHMAKLNEQYVLLERQINFPDEAPRPWAIDKMRATVNKLKQALYSAEFSHGQIHQND